MKDLKHANEFLKNKKSNKNEFRPSYHLSPNFGWCNDPHGINFFHGIYHIFFQYNPYDTKAENVFWGHVTSEDLIHFSKTSCAIAPDMPYDNSGCWSGSSIVIDDTLYLVYTGFALHEDGKYYQTINIAYSKDGVNFDKYDLNPIIDTKDIPSCASIYDFRDPCIFKKNGKLYIIVGSKSKDEKEAMLVLYEGEDIFHFHFLKKLVSSDKFGTMFECPNLVSFEDNNYIIMSPQNIKEKDGNFANVSSCVYFKLKGDFIHEEQTIEKVKEIDHGLEYYAPTVYNDEKILVNWVQMWGRRYYLDEIHNDFINTFSLFKKVKEKDGVLSFTPLSLENYVTEKKIEKIKLNGESQTYHNCHVHYQVKFEKDEELCLTLEFFDSKRDKVNFVIDCKNNIYQLDRSNVSIPLNGVEDSYAKDGKRYLKKEIPSNCVIDIYIDNAYVEIYFDNFEEGFSFINFSKEDRFSLKSNKLVEISLLSENIEVK